MSNDVYKFYKEKYDLKHLDIDVSKKKVLILIYRKKNYYLTDNLFIEECSNINILDKIDEYNKKYNLRICAFYPVCFCNDTLIIALKTKKLSNPLLKEVSYKKIDKRFEQLIQYHQINYCSSLLSLNIKNEISMSQKNIKRYKIHENFIKKYILTEKLRKKKEFFDLLNELIPNKKTIIDVSCGSNSDVFKIAKQKNYELIVGNDICLNYLNLNEDKNVIYTNDDVEINDIKENSYDVSFCKNTMHHMNDLNRINILLNFLKRISDTIIIVEIKDPREEGGLPTFLNKNLYTRFLKDVGTCYLNNEQFKEVIERNFENEKIEYKEFKNVLGTYMVAKITKR